MALSDLSKLGRKIGELAKPETFAQEVLIDWGNKIVIDFRDNLEAAGKYASGNLAGSIDPTKPEINDKGNLQLNIMMAPYWDYVNQGVNGLPPNQNRYGSEYSFKDPPQMATPSGQPTFRDSIKQWIALKGIAQISYTDKDGERVTIPMNINTLDQGATIIMKAVRRKGIAPSYFVDNALTEDAITDLENSIFEAIQKDLLA
jgi:hypothetical protein